MPTCVREPAEATTPRSGRISAAKRRTPGGRDPGFSGEFDWLRGKDSNLRPSGYEPDELPLLHPAKAFYCSRNRAPRSKAGALANPHAAQRQATRPLIRGADIARSPCSPVPLTVRERPALPATNHRRTTRSIPRLKNPYVALTWIAAIVTEPPGGPAPRGSARAGMRSTHDAHSDLATRPDGRRHRGPRRRRHRAGCRVRRGRNSRRQRRDCGADNRPGRFVWRGRPTRQARADRWLACRAPACSGTPSRPRRGHRHGSRRRADRAPARPRDGRSRSAAGR